jgi:large conductance mechanosensitive channel
MPTADEEMLAELQKIRALLTPAPAPVPPKGTWNEFKSFIDQYKVLGLAVAFILGVYLGNLVKALVSDLILPILSYIFPNISNIDTWMVGKFGVGDFLDNLVTFILVAVVIFLIVKGATRSKVQ